MLDKSVESIVDRAIEGESPSRDEMLMLMGIDVGSAEAAYVRWGGRRRSGGALRKALVKSTRKSASMPRRAPRTAPFARSPRATTQIRGEPRFQMTKSRTMQAFSTKRAFTLSPLWRRRHLISSISCKLSPRCATP